MLPGKIPVNNENALLKLCKKKKINKSVITQTIIIFYNRKSAIKAYDVQRH